MTLFVSRWSASNSTNDEDPSANDTAPSVTISPATLDDLPPGNEVVFIYFAIYVGSVQIYCNEYL